MSVRGEATPYRYGQQVRKALRRSRDEGDEAQQGTEVGREKEVEGHLRDYAGHDPVRSPNRDRRGEPSWKRAHRALRCAMPRIAGTSG